MGIIDSIKEKFGIGGSGGSDPDMSIANEYREIQPEEIRDEGQVEIIPHDEGKMKDVSRDKYYVERAIANRPSGERKRTAKRNKEIIQETASSAVGYVGRVYSGYKERVSRFNEGQLAKQAEMKPETSKETRAERISSMIVGRKPKSKRESRNAPYGSYGEGLPEKQEGEGEYTFSLRHGLKETEGSLRARHERETFENLTKRERQIAKETVGMTDDEKNLYKSQYIVNAAEKARQKAMKDNPVGMTYEERQEENKARIKAEREIKTAYRVSEAHARGSAAGKKATQEKKKGKGQSPATRRPASSIGNPAFTQGSERLVPHGFMPSSQGAPGFERPQGYGAPGFEPPRIMRPIGFEPQAPPTPASAPQPERRISRREIHRQQVNEMTRKAVAEQQQQQMPSFLVPQTQPMRGYQQPRGRLPEQPRFINLFEGHKPTNNNGNGSNKQSMPKMVNLFERNDVPTNTKIGKNKPHPLAEFSASLLGIGSIGTSRNGKRKHVKAPWE